MACIAPICWSKYTAHYLLTIVGGLRTLQQFMLEQLMVLFFSSKLHLVEKAYFSITRKFNIFSQLVTLLLTGGNGQSELLAEIHPELVKY